MTKLALSEDEIHKITGYARPTKQLEVLASLGVPARRRPDNSVLVLRMHLVHPATVSAQPEPKLKLIRK